MTLSHFTEIMIPAIENEIREIITCAQQQDFTNRSIVDLMSYHFGWSEENSINQKFQGKRIRPLLVLLTTESSGGNWNRALSSAAAIELIHNFSLIHDDIEDNSDLRRGRKTLWKTYSPALALNTGDALFSLSFIAISRSEDHLPEKIINQIYKLLAETCLHLTQGQHLDILFEAEDCLEMDDYWQMIQGKTAALIAASTKLGGLISGVTEEIQNHYYLLGKYLGLAFQIQDDVLGIWGDPKVTGKSIASDLIDRKKTLPILFGLAQRKLFFKLWQAPSNIDTIPLLASTLKKEGAYNYSKDQIKSLTERALLELEAIGVKNSASDALSELIDSLINRNL